MSGINSTIIIYNKKIEDREQLFESNIFGKKNRIISKYEQEFSINQYIKINNQKTYIYGDFLIEYSDSVKNFGFSDYLWTSIVNLIPNPICSIDFVSMSRNLGSAYVILKHLNELTVKGYCFYLINQKPNLETIRAFSFPDIKKVNEETYLLSSNIVFYWLENNIYDYLGFN